MDKPNNSVVITGLGIISPIGIGKDEFWESLRAGRSGVRQITVFDPGLFKAQMAAEVCNFSAETFLGQKGLRNFDRATRFLCSAAKLALDDGDLKIDNTNATEVGVVTATTLSAIRNISEFSQEAAQEGPQFVNPAGFPGTTINAPSSQVSIWFGIKGFNATVSTGYTAGLDALRYAVDFIRLGRVKAVLVAGVESLSFQNFVGFYNLGFLAGINGEEVSCPFDKRRNGIILGEGAGVVLIENEEYALRRNAHIYAKILSVESSFDAYRSGKYEPKAEGLKRVMSRAQKASGKGVHEIDYICAAANSVLQQDALETLAIKTVYESEALSIPVTSIKSMMGESISVAGIFQVAASAGAVCKNFIPPTINYKEFDAACDLEYVPNSAKEKEVHNVMINNFGPGGNNASAVISKYG